MNDIAEDIQTEINDIPNPIKEAATIFALGVAFGAAMIGAREIYKRKVRKEVFSNGEE